MFFSGQIRSQLTELELGISGALNVTERMEMLKLAIGLAIFLHTLWLCQNSYWKWPFSSWIFPLKMVIFHSYVSLPEGIFLNI